MKTAVIYYSWTGHTEKLAREKAEKEGASLYEIKDRNKPGKLKAYTAGCFSAMRMKKTPTLPLDAPLGEFERILIMAPVWAGHPAPAVNTVLDALPSGREVEMIMVSASGSSAAEEKVRAVVEQKGCKLTGYQDIQG